jgi:Zn-dependent M28 family amino/carboxypeptidase
VKPAPLRSILFIADTAEEMGLLGAKHYVSHPFVPLQETVANINLDGVNPFGRGSDMVMVGLGYSTLDDIVEAAARAQGRTVVPDPWPEEGFFYRSDHFAFAEKGVPAIFPFGSLRILGQPEGYGRRKADEYIAKDYHRVTDEVKPDWDLDGAVDDARLLMDVGFRVAQDEKYPEWKPGTEFRARREEMLEKKRHGRP